MAGPTLGDAVVEVGADTDPAERALRRAFRAFGDEGGTNFGRAFGRAVNREATPKTFSMLEFSFAKVALKAAGLLSLITPLPTALVGVAAGAVALAGSLVVASGSMLTAASSASSLGLALAGLKVGMIGIGDAWKLQQKAMEEMRVEGKVSETTQKQLDAAMKRLAPSARAVVKELRAMAPAWGKMRKEVQGNLFAQLAPHLSALGKTYLPLVQSALMGVTGTMNNNARAASNWLRSTEGVETIRTILDGLNRSFQSLLPAIGAIGKGMLTLFAGSQGPATSLSNSILNISQRFRDWATAVTESGEFQQFLRDAHVAAGDLLSMIGNLGKVLFTVFRAGSASGNSMLRTMSDGLARFNEFLNSAKGQNALASFFDTIGVAAQTARDLFSVFAPVISGIGSVVSSLTPAFDSMRAALLPIAQAVGGKLGKGLGEIASMISSQLVPAFQQMLPVIAPVLRFLLNIFGGAVIGAIKGFVTLLTGAFQIITGVFNVFKAIFTGNWSLLWSSLGLILQGAWNVIKGIIQIAFNVGILGVFRKGIAVLRGLWTGFWNGLRAIPGVVMTFIRGLIEGAWEGIKAVFRGGGSAIRGAASAAFGAVRSLASGGMSALGNLIRTGISRAVGFFRGLPGKVKSAMSSLVSNLKSIGTNAMNGLWNGITAGAKKVLDKAGEIAGKVKDKIAGALKIFSPSRVMMGLGENITKGLTIGIAAQQKNLARQMDSIANTISSMDNRRVADVTPPPARILPPPPNNAAPIVNVPEQQPLSDAAMRRQAKLNAEALLGGTFRLQSDGNLQLIGLGG